ncbi:MAG TPA: dienelactone hydrolase family protein [Candidatus Acidoferrales bacterium]|jgi:carboxymethylenebutenolidase|nr:dienelactone hydrolase family protein [Candidatus Acidoferrales bacterium]
MGNKISLTAPDGHTFGAYRSDPSSAPKKGVVVIQEIFGVNHHIRAVCDRLAAAGYAAVAPALFDRIEPGFESGYSPEEISAAMRFVQNPDFGAFLRDTSAAIKELSGVGPVSIMGFCLGGTVAFASACNLDGLASAVCYYGGFIAKMADQKPKCPTLMHFGALDKHIPLSDVETIREKRPDCEIYVYPGADHGFNCDERASYNKEAAALAWQRSLDWMGKAREKA